MASYRVASVEELPGETMKRVDAGSTPVCLAHAEDGNFYALNDVCTHEEFSLCDGELWGMDVECPQHGDGAARSHPDADVSSHRGGR